ncbi:MAG: glycosyltransferase [Gammaproteobacteria bacterium PRO9]|nr:glycosyltransferase [Gammaproteobacteria bacterium PRO9]
MIAGSGQAGSTPPDQRLRVLFILPSLTRAGAEIQTVSLINGLDSRRFKKCLVVFEEQLDLLDRVDQDNVDFRHIKRQRKLDIPLAKTLASLIEREQIDVVHCSLQIAFFFGWCAVRLARRRPALVLALHTTKNRNRRNERFDRYVYQWMMRSADQVVCVCKAQRGAWIERFPFLRNRIQVVYNGIDTEWFRRDGMQEAAMRTRRGLGLSPEAFVITSVAAFRPEKGHAILSRAMQALLAQVPQAHLLLAGDGMLRPSIEAQVRELELTQHVHFLGSQPDVRPVLAASDVSVIASTAVETFSLAMLESLSMEVPVVASDIGGMSEAVRPGETGLLVEAGNARALSDALTRLANDPEARRAMARNGRRMVEREFTVESMLRETATVIEAAVSSP